MPLISEMEQRLRVYEDFLRNPASVAGNFSEGSYERRAYRVALRRSLQDLDRLLTIVKALRE